MKRLFAVLFVFIIFLSFVSTSFAYVNVRGYYRSDGTYVRPYVRSNPNGLRYDNYSYTGGSVYNSSYYTPNYSSSWYQPTWDTDSSYYYGKSIYDNYNTYGSYYYNW